VELLGFTMDDTDSITESGLRKMYGVE
jgi:hypothetical protein